MTRATVRARQANDVDPGARLTRVTITAVGDTTVTVELPGGDTTTAPRVGGAAYTVGQTAFALAQEPAVGPILPIGPEVQAPAYGACAYATATQSISANTGTQVTLAGSLFNDSADTYTLSSAGIEVNTPGMYLFECAADFDAGAGAEKRTIYIQQNGSNKGESSVYTGGPEVRVRLSIVLRCAANDQITMNVFSPYATDLLAADSKDTQMRVARLGS